MTDHPAPPLNASPDVSEPMTEAIAAYALDALPPEEHAAVVAHLAANPAARALLDEYRAVVDMMPYAAVPSAPPPALKDDLLRAAREQRKPRRLKVLAYWCAPAIAACLLLSLVVWNVALQSHRAPAPSAAQQFASIASQPGVEMYSMAADTAAPGSWGRVYLTHDGKQTGVTVRGLPQLTQGHVYQLWFRRDDQSRVSVGTFTVDASGAAVLVTTVPRSDRPYVSCGVTEEPHGGSPAPTGPRVLASGVWMAPENGY